MTKTIAERKFGADIYPIVFLLFAVWAAIILGIGALLRAGETQNLAEGLTGRIQLGVLAAMIFGIACVAFWRIWKQTGFTNPARDARWSLLIPFLLFIVIFFAFGFRFLDLTTSALLILTINALLVATSEETMLRGLVFSGLSSRYSFWSACVVSTLMFGAMHLLNIFTTGEIPILQAFTTVGTGFMLLAIRVGMGSIVPAIIAHWLWDMSTAMVGSIGDLSAIEGTPWQFVPLGIILAPVVFAIVGITYLWRVRNEMDAAGEAGA